MSLPVAKTLDHLFGLLIEQRTATDPLPGIPESIGTIAFAYPSVWVEEFRLRLSNLKPSVQQTEWIALLSHMGACTPFPHLADKEIEPILEHCLTSIYSVDVRVRQAGLVGLERISTKNLSLVVNKLAFSLKIYTLNEQVVALLDHLTHLTREAELTRKILTVIQALLQEEGAVRPDLLGDLASCVSNVIMVTPELRTILESLKDLLIPMSWRQDLVLSSSPSLFGIYKAVCYLISILGAPRATIVGIQSGLLRLLVHAKTSKELITVLDTVRIFSEKFFASDEEVHACIPILIDIGVALGPLSLLGPVDNGHTVQRALHDALQTMPNRGISFILDRASHANQLSVVDRLVTLVYLHWSLNASLRPDSVVSCIDSICGAKQEPFFAIILLELIAKAVCLVPSFLLTVPVIDFVISWAILRDATETPSSLKTYWFSAPNGKISDSGPSSADVQKKAQQVLVLLAESADKDSVPALRERLMECLGRLPVKGLDSVVEALVKIGDLKRNISALAWIAVHVESELLGRFASMTLKKGLPSNASRISEFLASVPATLRTDISVEIFSCLLSKHFFEVPQSIPKCVPVAEELVPLLPSGSAVRVLIDCLQKCDQEIMKEESCVELFGSLIGKIPFVEYQQLVREMSQYLYKSRNRLIVIIGLKKNSSEILSSIVRHSLGVSAENLTKVSDILPVLNDMYLDPCFETLTNPQVETEALRVTLDALAKIVRAVSSILAQTDGGEYTNRFISAILPIVIKKQGPMSFQAMECLTALCAVNGLTLTTSNFDLCLQYSVSVLVHGITTFSSIEVHPYTERIQTVSALLVATLAHSFNPWLGLSRFAQLIHLAGSSSPLPIIRTISMHVYNRVVESIAKPYTREKSNPIEWIETLVVVILRLRDPVTEVHARDVLKILLKARNVDPQSLVETIVENEEILPPECVLPTVQLLLHAAATDADHNASVYALKVLHHIIVQRRCISSKDSPGLVSSLLAYAEKRLLLQPEILACVHALSSIHLSASLQEIITEVLSSSDHAFSDSQIGAIQSIAKEKSLIVGFVTFMTDLINNTEPSVQGTVASEAKIAAKALDIALSVPDSLIPAMVMKFAAPLFGTAILYQSVSDSDVLTLTVMRRLNLDTSDNDLMQFLNRFIAASETHVYGLMDFLIPFMTRDGRGITCTETQKKSAEKFLCALTPKCDNETAGKIREAFRSVCSVKGLRELLIHKRNRFTEEDIQLVSEVLGNSTTHLNTVSDCLDVLITSCGLAAKVGGDPAWQSVLLNQGGLVTTLLTTRLRSEDVSTNLMLFKQAINLLAGLCDVAAFADESSAFTTVLETNLATELRIRSHILTDMGDMVDHQLPEKALYKVSKIVSAGQTFTMQDFDTCLLAYLDPKSVEFYSMSSPSQSPLVVKGAASLAVEIANGCQDDLDRSRIIATMMRFVRNRQKSFLFDGAKEHVIAAMGDLTVDVLIK